MIEQKNYCIEKLFTIKLQEEPNLIDKKEVEIWIENLYSWLLGGQKTPNDFDSFQQTAFELETKLHFFLEQLNISNIVITANLFFEELFEVYKILDTDLSAVLEFDPAAQSRLEVLVSYPGFYATAVHQIGRAHV